MDIKYSEWKDNPIFNIKNHSNLTAHNSLLNKKTIQIIHSKILMLFHTLHRKIL